MEAFADCPSFREESQGSESREPDARQESRRYFRQVRCDEDWSNDELYEILKQYSEKEGVKAGFTIWPVRIAVSGKAVTPAGATEIMEVLGKEESLLRIREGIRRLSDAQ